MAIADDDGEMVEGWQRSLERFDRLIWPLFENRGYSKDAAYLYWTLNRVVNELEELSLNITPYNNRRENDEDEPWKQ